MTGICNVSVAPVRAEKSDRSEMVTQMLFGESAEIIEVHENWAHVKLNYDDYEGWMDSKQLSTTEVEKSKSLVSQPFQEFEIHGNKYLLSLGSEISESVPDFRWENLRESILQMALKFLEVPYLWGGRSFFGIDCSGFVQVIFKVHGIKMPRDASQQAQGGEDVAFVEEAQPGDLAFFENEEEKITHVGIMISNSKIIHAHGKVRIDKIDSTGIFNEDQKKYTHKLRFIRDFIS